MLEASDKVARRRLTLIIITLSALPCYCIGWIALMIAPGSASGTMTPTLSSTSIFTATGTLQIPFITITLTPNIITETSSPIPTFTASATSTSTASMTSTPFQPITNTPSSTFIPTQTASLTSVPTFTSTFVSTITYTPTVPSPTPVTPTYTQTPSLTPFPIKAP